MSDDNRLDDGLCRTMETALELLEWVPPENVEIFVATYVALQHSEEETLKTPWRPIGALPIQKKVTVSKPGAWITSKDGLKTFLRYGVVYDKAPLPKLELNAWKGKTIPGMAYHIPREWTPTENGIFYLVTQSRFADLVWDDLPEMLACGFQWAHSVAFLSHEMRSDLFSRNLHQQKEKPVSVAADGRQWIRELAEYGTYDSDGNYYQKWTANQPGPKRMHTEKYRKAVELNRQEMILAKGLLYMIVETDQGSVIYSLVLEGDKTIKIVPHRLSAGALWQMGSRGQNAAAKKRFKVYFLGTAESEHKGESTAARKGGYDLRKGDQASYLVADPRKLVAAAIGDEEVKELTKTIPEGNEEKWFLLALGHLFREPYYKIALDQIQHRQLVQNHGGVGALREQVNATIELAWSTMQPEAGRPLTAAARAKVRGWMARKNTLVLPQGFPTSSRTRFMGHDGTYAFERDIENGFIYVRPIDEYVEEMVQSSFWKDVHRDVKWLVPMMEGVTWLAAVAVPGGVAMGAVKYAARYAAKQVTKNVLWEAVKSVTPALVAKAVEILIDVMGPAVFEIVKKIDASDGRVDRDYASAEEYMERWKRFLHGFFDGFIRLNIAARVEKLKDLVLPMEAKIARTAAELYELLDKFRDFLEKMQGKLTDAALARILVQLEKSATHLVKGVASLLGVLYYVDPEAAAPILEFLTPDGKPPKPEDWGKEVHKAVGSISEKLDGAGNQIGDLREMLDLSSTKPYAIGAAVAFGYASFLIVGLKTLVGTGGLVAIFGLLGIGVLAYAGKLGEAKDVLGHLLSGLPNLFPGKDAKSAEVHGQLIGNLIGTFMVDGALFGSGSTLGARLDKSKKLRIAVEGTFGGSIVKTILKILFARYVVLAEKIADKVELEHSALKGFVDKERDARNAGNVFHSKSDDRLGLREVMDMLVFLRDRLAADMTGFRESYKGGVAELKAELRATNELTKKAGFDLEKLAHEQTRILLIQMNTQAYNALTEFLKALDALFVEVAGDETVMSILGALGIDAGDLSGVHETVRKAVEPRMQAFVGKAQKLENEKAAEATEERKQAEANREREAERQTREIERVRMQRRWSPR